MGGPDYGILEELVAFERPTFSPAIDDLVRDLARFMPLRELYRLCDWYNPPPPEALERMLRARRAALLEDAERGQWDLSAPFPNAPTMRDVLQQLERLVGRGDTAVELFVPYRLQHVGGAIPPDVICEVIREKAESLGYSVETWTRGDGGRLYRLRRQTAGS